MILVRSLFVPAIHSSWRFHCWWWLLLTWFLRPTEWWKWKARSFKKLPLLALNKCNKLNEMLLNVSWRCGKSCFTAVHRRVLEIVLRTFLIKRSINKLTFIWLNCTKRALIQISSMKTSCKWKLLDEVKQNYIVVCYWQHINYLRIAPHWATSPLFISLIKA